MGLNFFLYFNFFIILNCRNRINNELLLPMFICYFCGLMQYTLYCSILLSIVFNSIVFVYFHHFIGRFLSPWCSFYFVLFWVNIGDSILVFYWFFYNSILTLYVNFLLSSVYHSCCYLLFFILISLIVILLRAVCILIDDVPQFSFSTILWFSS